MSEAKLISKNELWQVLKALQNLPDNEHDAHLLFAPDKDGHWSQYHDEQFPALGPARPKRPLKDLFLPQQREIATCQSDQEDPRFMPAAIDQRKGIVYGVRPCDARALLLLDKIFLEKPYIDPHYQARRNNLTLLGLACQIEANCNCGIFGLSPDDANGIDLMLYPQDDEHFIALANSAKGKKLLDVVSNTQAGDLPTARPGPKPSWWQETPSPELLLANFAHAVWSELNSTCMNCGVCTLYCPSCQCFSIVDEHHKSTIVRKRIGDTCQRGDFTRMAGGHNPRDVATARLRQRVLHKFAYYPSNFDGAYGCTGCGRCLELCGLGRNIFADLVEIGRRLQEETGHASR